MTALCISHAATRWIAIAILLIVLAAGCSQSPPATPPNAPGSTTVPAEQPIVAAPTEPTPPNESPTTVGKIELQVVDLRGYEAAVARHRGQVVMVDFWATWCVPCRRQFQHSIELQHKYQDRGLVVMTVSIDQMDAGESLDDLKIKVLDFLKGQKSTLTNLLVPVTDLAPGDSGAIDLVAERFDVDGGAVPHNKLYDRLGNLSRKFVIDLETGEEFKLKDIEAAIEKLL